MPQTPTATPPSRPGARHIELRVERLDGGRIRVSTPQHRGWAVVVRGPWQLWTAVGQAFTEATVAGYALWKGERPELDALTERDDPTEPPPRKVTSTDELAARAEKRHGRSYAREAITRPDVAPPECWTPNADGTWTSPGVGRRWRADAPHVQRVIAKRAELGLATTYEELFGTEEGAS